MKETKLGTLAKWSPLAAFVIACAACAGSLSDPASFESEGSDAGTPSVVAADGAAADAAVAAPCPDVPTTLAQTCGVAGCHDSMTRAESLDLASAGVASRLVGVAAVEGAGLLIDPATPSASVVYTKLLKPPPFGAQMPTGVPLDGPTIQCILGWVTTAASTGDADGGTAAGDAAGTGDDAAPPFSPLRVAAGQTTAITDAVGDVWSADEGFTGGTAAVTSPPTAITGTTTPALYNGQRYGDPSFSYLFSVPNGTYAVTLKFAEQFVTGPGMREFDVAINGATVETDFDIYAAAGAMNAAVDESFTVNVTGGMIQIAFTAGPVQFPKVDAIEITQGAAAADGGT